MFQYAIVFKLHKFFNPTLIFIFINSYTYLNLLIHGHIWNNGGTVAGFQSGPTITKVGSDFAHPRKKENKYSLRIIEVIFSIVNG